MSKEMDGMLEYDVCTKTKTNICRDTMNIDVT